MIKWRSVRIPNKLYEEVNQRKGDLNCTSVSEVARKALEEFLILHKEKGGSNDGRS
ncbi:MAG: hypothetical protein RXO36_06675 [Candidatus Nanopusillus acidilobi]|jgi:metal-responsive CopG/Arc/MetJ family transcriptional regulator